MLEALRPACQLERLGDSARRLALATAETAAPELLTLLAADPAPEVRQAVAAHAATPPVAHRLLAADAEATVRAELARRVAALALQLGPGAPDRMARLTAGTLALLVADATVQVRAAIAEAVSGLPEAPRELILRLARDTAMQVAEPVIRMSPLLTEADLLALVADPPAPGTRRAVARRDDLPEGVCDAIAATADTPAVAALLANPSAAIREVTLDALVEGAGARPSWQDALVRRARLPERAAQALAGIVADHLLALLAARPDLPEGLAATLRARVAARLAGDPTEAAPAEVPLFAACRAGDRTALRAALARDAGTSLARIDGVIALRSGRAIAALCHRAGWSPRLAAEVQTALGGLMLAEVVQPTPEGAWALGEAELHWQAELLEGLPE